MYYEFNMINVIPIFDKNFSKKQIFNYPKYKIIDQNNILQCFMPKQSKINIYGKIFKYIKIDISKYFSLVDVKALFYYVLVEENFEFDNGIDKENLERFCESNNYIMITCPVLKQGNEFYVISNNMQYERIYISSNSLQDDEYIINRMIYNGGYSFGDNINVLLALYNNNTICKHKLVEMINKVKGNMILQKTDNIILFLMSSYKVKNLACDFYSIFLIQNIKTTDTDILSLFDTYIFRNQSFVQSEIRNKKVFITKSSCMYPYLNEIPSFHRWSKENMYIIDMYGLFASIIYNETLFKKWLEVQDKILNNYKLLFGDNMSLLMIHVLNSLIMLYIYGYEDIILNQKYIIEIWRNIISKEYSQEALKYILIYNRVPDELLLTIYEMNKINIIEKKIMLVYDIDVDDYIYKMISYSDLIKFYQKLKQKKIQNGLLCINRFFCNENCCKDMNLIGSILKDYVCEDPTRIV